MFSVMVLPDQEQREAGLELLRATGAAFSI